MGGTAGTQEAYGIAIGYRAMFEVEDGSSGIAIGNSALDHLVGQGSVAIGSQAGFYATGSSPLAAEAGNNSMLYTFPSIVDDLTLKASYSPGSAGGSSATSWSASYAGVEGLTLDYGTGQVETVGSEADVTTMKASYAISSFTISYSNTEAEHDATSNTDEEISSWNIAYTVSDDLSIAYGTEVIETEGSSPDEEAEKLNVSYTTGGVTISATQYNFENRGNSTTEAATTGDHSRWALSASFAF